MKISSFRINKLHGCLNYELKLQDNTLILIGENGSCKTTIIKVLFYTLSMQWDKLSKYNFDHIIVGIENEEIKIYQKDIVSFCSIDNHFFRRIPLQIKREIMSAKDLNGAIDIGRIELICKKYDVPLDYILGEMNFNINLFSESKNPKASTNIKAITSKLKEYLQNIHIIYLPTYRRIEQELKVVLDGRVDESEFRSRRMRNRVHDNSFTELVEFGMDDVAQARDRSLNELKDYFRNSLNQLTLGYLGDVVDEKYNDVNSTFLNDIDEDTINNIMQRVDESILSKERKTKLIKSIEKIKNDGVNNVHDKVVCHYFNKLLISHRELESKEIYIRKFAEICSKYLRNKTVSYDSANFTFSIVSNIAEQAIEFGQLSSGEKQIVSLFSHLYLDGKRKYFVLIDEPELSLSVKWQKQFLADINKGEYCSGIVAVTHSPFIFENELDSYAHGIEEFIKK